MRQPKKIDHYDVIREIGRGGMGNVYLCRDTEIGRVVALKVMREDLTRPVRDSDRQRFIREALTTARLQHPGIPPVFVVRRSSQGLLYYAMKLIDGSSLDEILKKLVAEDPEAEEKFNMHRMVSILRDVCQALSYAHAKGFLHRDLKPSNIFIGDYGEVYLIDWGLTKKFIGEDDLDSLDIEESTLLKAIEMDEETELDIISSSSLLDDAPDETEQLTLQGDLVGTPSYMAPESTWRNPPPPAPTSDIYSLGVLLYRILTLRLPVRGKDLKELVKAKREGQLTHPDEVAPERDIPPELAAISMQAMSTDPADRLATVQEFSRSLEFWLDGKTQFRKVDLGIFTPDKFICRPPQTGNRWKMKDQVLKTVSMGHGQLSRLFFRRAFYGDIRIELNLRVLSIEKEDEGMRRFGIMFKCSEPVSMGSIDHYALIFAGNNNTRLSLSRNGTEIASNENIIFEPDKKYNINIETHRGDIQVTINSRLVLSCMDRSPLSGSWLGFIHHGQSVIYSRLNVMTRGLPIKTETIEIPETLMAEGSYDGAYRRYMDIYRNHRYRYVGNWAAYRAGIAAYRMNKQRSDALRVWAGLRDTRYSALELLGKARIELIEDNPLEAAKHIENILTTNPPNVLLRSVADFAQEHTQNLLRRENDLKVTWEATDQWIRLTLALDQRLERHDPITLSLLWHWLFHIIHSQPKSLKSALSFMHRTYGEGQGEFLELITNEDQLQILIKRSQTMRNHTFLIEKIMRLIIWHEDPIDDLETLGRFYLNSGHERIALQIFQQLIKICINAKISVPPAPCAYVGCYLWLHDEEREARRIFKIMEKSSTRWGPSDAQFFIGLDDYRRGRRLNAVQRWKSIQQDTKTDKPFRQIIASALLGQLPPDPDKAGVPERHDYRFLFVFFLGLRYLIDYREDNDMQARKISIRLFTEVQQLMKPSYDIYASATSFAYTPLELLQAPHPAREKPEILGNDEKNWLKLLIMTVKNEMISSSS